MIEKERGSGIWNQISRIIRRGRPETSLTKVSTKPESASSVNEFGLYLERLIKERGAKSVGLARALQVSQATVSLYIHGERKPKLRRTLQIADFLKLEKTEKRRFLDLAGYPKAELESDNLVC